MSQPMHQLARTLAYALIGLGIAILVRTALAEGPQGLRWGYLVGTALIVTGLARIKLAGGVREGRD